MSESKKKMNYKINVDDRYYNHYEYFCALTKDKVELDLDPVKYKILNQDIFEIIDNEEGEIHVNILHSTTREMNVIPAILVLESNKIYGKTKKNKPLYRCIPDDRRMPEFLVPYQPKMSFKKNLVNKYVTFQYHSWEGKHPEGRLTNVLGDVTVLDNFYEYQLYCKSLYASIQDFTKKTIRALKKKSQEHFIDKIMNDYKIEDRREYEIVSIDPESSKDFDDAFGLIENDENYILSIYISNVSYWMDALDLWSSFSQRISTIYLPDRKRPMLPTILSDALCSLQEGNVRFAFVLDLTIKKETMEIMNEKFSNCAIMVNKNLRYETDEMFNYPMYKKSFKLVKNLNKKYKYIDNIRTSHEFIAYLMVLMNYVSATKFMEYKKGIYRSVKVNNTFVTPKDAPADITNFLKMWNSFGGNYLKFKNMDSHDILEFDAYVHITSPIRRLVDLLNIIEFQDHVGLFKMTEKTREFYDKWTSDESMEYINRTMRSIRKVQNDCNLLNICTNDKTIMDRYHEGYVFDKITRNDKLFQYMIYIPEFKMVNRLTSRFDIPLLSKQKFRLFVFKDESRLKEKIRVDLLIE